MEFASEMLVKSSILRLRTTEIPITLHKDGRDRRPHLKTWSDGWRHLKYILLFAPKFIYWIPGLFCLLVGGILAIALNLTPEGQPVSFAGFLFNDHWIVVAALLFLIGYEILFTGLLAYLYTLTHRVKQRSVKIEKLIRWVSLEKILLLTALLLISGLALEFSVIKAWISGDFANLNAFRPAITGMALILMPRQREPASRDRRSAGRHDRAGAAGARLRRCRRRARRPQGRLRRSDRGPRPHRRAAALRGARAAQVLAPRACDRERSVDARRPPTPRASPHPPRGGLPRDRRRRETS